MAVQSPQKVPDTPNRPGSARASPRKESQSRVQTVAAQNFYSVAPTKSFKDWDEDLCLAPAFLVERDGVLMRSDQVKVMEEQVRAERGARRGFVSVRDVCAGGRMRDVMWTRATQRRLARSQSMAFDPLKRQRQEATIKTLEGKVTAKSNQIDKLAKQNKDGKQQQKLDKLTAELETLVSVSA
jgi:hypothetical protein